MSNCGALLFFGHALGTGEVGDRRLIAAVDGGRLIGLRQKAGRPDGLAATGHRSVQDHKARQVLIFAAQPVSHPGADARPALQKHAGVHFQHGRSMVVGLRVAGVKQGHLIHVPGHVRKDFRNPGPRLAVPLKLERRLQTFSTGGKEAGFGIGPIQFRAVPFLELRLVVEGIDLRGAAGHEQPDHRFRFGGEMRCAGLHQAGRIGGRGREQPFLVQQARQGQSPAAQARVFQEGAARTKIKSRRRHESES